MPIKARGMGVRKMHFAVWNTRCLQLLLVLCTRILAEPEGTDTNEPSHVCKTRGNEEADDNSEEDRVLLYRSCAPSFYPLCNAQKPPPAVTIS